MTAFGLYRSQAEALKQMHDGCILCGDVGSGKSRTSLAYFYSKVCGGNPIYNSTSSVPSLPRPIPLYIITTAMKRDNCEWEKECAHFFISKNPSISLVPLAIDSWNNIKKYADVEGAFFIFDEQRLVGTGAWVKAFLKIAKRNKWILLSATPGDVWSDYAPVFIANGYYKNITEFRRKHVVYNRFSKFPKVDHYVGTKELDAHRRSLLVDIKNEKVAVQHHSWVKVGYDKDLYDIVRKNRWNVFDNEPIENVSEYCYILRKIANSDTYRLRSLSRILEKHPKAIVFYNFDYELESLRSFCDRTEYDYAEWNGHKHEEVPTGPSWVYLVQYTAGSEGWNCITTDTTVFYSQSYSYRATKQASGRIDRINTPFTDLYYFHIFSDSPIDKQIKACLSKKKEFNVNGFRKEFESQEPLTKDGEQLQLDIL